MKTNQKGFTLIELLAVIIILAIIALIAVPTIMNIIDSSKKSAAADSAYGLISAAELWYSTALLEGKGVVSAGDITFTNSDKTFTIAEGSTLDSGITTKSFIIKGNAPDVAVTNLKITSDGKVDFTAKFNDHTCTVANGELGNNGQCS